MEQPRESWDRRAQIDVAERLGRIEEVLRGVESEARMHNGRMKRMEAEVERHHHILYGSATELDDGGGIVGMLRQLRKGQQVTIAILASVAVPAALTVFATYLPRLF